MALDLFKKIEPRKGLFGVEKIALIYIGLTSLLIIGLYPELDSPLKMFFDRAVIVCGTYLLVMLYRFKPSKVTAFTRIAFQMALLSYWYPDTYELNRVLPNLDHLFAAAEQFIFNGQPAITFSSSFPQTWISEAFNMGYFAYYPMIFLVALVYFFKRYYEFEKVAFILVGSFFIYYLMYIFIPVAGPQYYFPAIGWENVEAGIFPSIGDYFNHNYQLLPGPGEGSGGFFYGLVDNSQQLGERPTAAFPSSHVGISTILMLPGWKVSKRMTLFLLPFYLLLCGATVYIQAHYVIDSIAGFVSAFLVYYAVSWSYERYFAVECVDSTKLSFMRSPKR